MGMIVLIVSVGKGDNVMKRGLCASLAVICLTLLASCGGGGGGGSGGVAAVAPSTGSVSVSLTDASTTDYRAVYVTISQVAVHRDGGDWDVVSSPNRTVNLLDLVNGVRQDLGLATLTAGPYTQMRLILASTPDASVNILSHAHPYANYFIDTSSPAQEIELKVPSGLQSGIKIVKGFDINANQTTELILDFDAVRSIVKAGNSGKWLLKPTIKVLNAIEYSIIQGNAGGAGVLVSAQTYNSSVTPAETKVQVRAATVSDANGNYKLFVEPGSYTLVGYKDDRLPYHKDQKVVTAAGDVVNVSFSLFTAAVGTLTGGPITIPGTDQEQYATISIRQDATVNNKTEQIEVKSLNVADGGTFDADLPAGSYTAVISTFGQTTLIPPTFTITESTVKDIGPIDF
jgi:hypothetical protein